MNATRILVVDDEPQITRALRTGLSSKGFEVQVCLEGEEALGLFHRWKPDVIITDLVMPGMGGLELTRQLRKISGVPIIILSVKGEETSKVEALDMGADDYLTKPFGMDELLARIRVVLRRVSAPVQDDSVTLKIGDFVVEQAARIVKVRNQPVHLTPKEYDLLLFFLRNPNRVLTHRVLLGAIWGGQSVEQSEYLRFFVGQLRKKIEQDPAKPQYIITDPWVGYRFNPGTSASS